MSKASADHAPVIVEHLTPEAAIQLAGPIMALVGRTYGDQLERQMNLMPAGTVAAEFDFLDARRVTRYAKRIEAHIDRGSQYAVIKGADPDFPLVNGLIETTPGSAMPHIPDEVLYVNNILVAPDQESRGNRWGSALLYAGIIGHTDDLKAPLGLEGVTDSPINRWFQRIGLVRQHASSPIWLRGYNVPMEYYQTPPGKNIADVAAALDPPPFIHQTSV